MIFRHMSCCGFREIDDLSLIRNDEFTLPLMRSLGFDPDYYYAMGRRRLLPRPAIRFAHLLFTEAGTKSKYGAKFKAWIEREGLGTVTVSPAKKNPNSRRMVKGYIWSIDRDALRAWYARNLEEAQRQIWR